MTTDRKAPAPEAAGTRFFIYGPPGVGKSTLGHSLAQNLDLPYSDLDAEIEAAAGLTIPEIFGSEGEGGFRARERAALGEALARGSMVVALGAGALLDRENRSRVEAAGFVLCLTASPGTLLSRLRSAEAQRPLLAGDDTSRLMALLAQRADHYASFHLRLDTSSLEPARAVEEAQVQLGAFRVRGMGEGYDVRVVPGGLQRLGQELQLRGLQGPIGLVSDENVAALYAQGVIEGLQRHGYEVTDIVVPPGESQKTVTTLQHIWSALLAAGIERASTVLALGGGVVGDLTGFASATLFRGVRWVAAPTSLLAMVDASLGGKTGADLADGKNLIGAFHPPSLVMADPRALATLPEPELGSGLAEVVKHGVIADPNLFQLCAAGLQTLRRDWSAVVRRAMAIKIRIIEDDPFERGPRAALNLGHTVGHALEKASGFRLRHGEAIAIGLVAEARLAERLSLAEPGLATTIARVLESLGLPTEIPPDLDPQSILDAMRVDKKRRQGVVRFALPRRVGEVQVGVAVDRLELAL